MPETPNFDQIASVLVDAIDGGPAARFGGAAARILVVEELRQVWNARGAADLVTIEADLSSMMGVTAAGPYVKNLDRALRRLDR